MSLVITFPEDAARRLAAAAAGRGTTPEELAIGLVVEHLPPVDAESDARATLEAFVGSVSGDGSRFDIHAARRERAARQATRGTRSL